MERWLGADFTDVRVHTDTEAQRSAHAMGAAAYTVGRDIVFGAGRYAPESVSGAWVLAHELTHVVQQQRAESVLAPEVVCPSDASEAEAYRAAPVSRLSRQAIQMLPEAGGGTAPPEVSPEGVAQKIESLLDQIFLSDDDQKLIGDLLLSVANTHTSGVKPGDALGRVFSRLRSDRPSRLRMAIHAPIAALTNADPTYYDVLFDRMDAFYQPTVIGMRDLTIYRGVGSATQVAGVEKRQKEEREEEETARFEGWQPGPFECAPLPHNARNVFLAKRVIEQLAAAPENQLNPEGRYLLGRVSKEGVDAVINVLLTSCHSATPGERRRYFRESVGKLVLSLLEWVAIDMAAELAIPLIVEGAAGAAKGEELAAGGRAAEETTEARAGETAVGEETAAGPELERRVFHKPTVTGDPGLPAGTGRTNKFGDITYSTLGSQTDVALVRYHEQVHSWLSPKLMPLRTIRADLRMAAYQRSSFMQYLEEALAETYAQLRVHGLAGLPTGITFPITNGYVTVSAVVTEAAIGTITVGGVTYGVYVVADRLSSEAIKPSGQEAKSPTR